MTEALKELIPVIQEAIRAGKTIGLGYLIVLVLIPFIQSLAKYVFYYLGLKMIIEGIKYLFTEKSSV